MRGRSARLGDGSTQAKAWPTDASHDQETQHLITTELAGPLRKQQGRKLDNEFDQHQHRRSDPVLGEWSRLDMAQAVGSIAESRRLVRKTELPRPHADRVAAQPSAGSSAR